MERGEVLWAPAPDAFETTRLGRFAREQGYADYASLWQWSVDELEAFWAALSDHLGMRWRATPERVLAGGDRHMPGARWFPGGELNYAEHALGAPPDLAAPAVVAHSQTRDVVRLSWGALRDQVARCRAGLAALGVGRGDRVAAYAPNIPETAVAFLATASLGAVWSSCAPEFGTRSVIDRFAQIDPVVLIAVDGYRYGAKEIQRGDEVATIRAALPSLRAVVSIPYLRGELPDATPWPDVLAAEGDLSFEAVPFDHPLYVLYSSGTTGLPKAIVHGHGGITVEHLKTLALHHDLGAGDVFTWFTTTGWMMWNYLMSGLLVGATLLLYDGDPAHPDLRTLWRVVAEERAALFGTSAGFLMACRKAGLVPRDELDLSALRSVGSTGAPLPADGFRWVHDAVGERVQLASVSGGTDVCTGFVGAAPLVPVRAGEISCRLLGCRVEAFDEDGRSVVGEQGELVITEPMPSMPVGFWNDPDGSRYRNAYFADYPGVWRHGDWITFTEDGACTISGRSDATLNRGGVRLGTSDFYAAVESLPEVADSLVVHLEGDDERLVLFVALAPGAALDDDLRGRISSLLRRELSPRHVPDEIVAVPAVPRTLSGKKLEVPVKRILTGTPADVAASKGSLADPDALSFFEAYAAGQTSR